MGRILTLVCLALLTASPAALALDTETRAVGPVMTWRTDDLNRFDPEWLQVKFVEGSNVRLESRHLVDDSGTDLEPVNRLLESPRVTEVRPTFHQDRAQLRAWKAEGEARCGQIGPDLSLWFNVRVSGGEAQVARLVNQLNRCDAVEIAHPVPMVEPAVIVPTTAGATASPPRTPDFTDQQDYLYEPPVGLDAPAAWAMAGGRGELMKFIDVELCWTEDHEDFEFPNNFYQGGAPQDPGYEPHGTAVLGEVIGSHNDYGIDGFAPATQYGVVAIDIDLYPDVAQYFQEALDQLDRGDVWLIELQMYPPDRSATPMEWLQVNYDVIWTSAWAREVVCVEAGANGSQDLDDRSWGGVFDRDLRDSGAIMVGAGTPVGRVAESFTNYGSRMDVHAWGSEIVTTGYGDLYNGGSLQTKYTQGFGGTSGASPMIVGCCLCLQGIAKALGIEPLAPVALRTMLNQTGIPHLDPNKEIGPRPDLAAALEALSAYYAASPDVDRVGRAHLTCSPNPVRSGTEIRFRISSPGEAHLVLFDSSGRRVRTLVDGLRDRGEYRIAWDGLDDAGRRVDNGVYFFRLRDGGASRAGRLEVIR